MPHYKTHAQRTDDVLHAIGRWMDEWPADEWPPLLPNEYQLAQMEGSDFTHKLAKRKLDKLSQGDKPFTKKHGHRYSLTIWALQWLYDRGYLRRYLRPADSEWGVRVARLELLYPT